MQMIHIGRRGSGWRIDPNWLSGYSYRKSFTYSRASGAVENYQVKLMIAEPAGGLLFSDCEATTGWSASNNAVSIDTGCVGTYCLKFTGGDRGGGDPYYVVKNLSPYQNWVAAGYKTMTLWHKCSDGATTFQVRITSNGTNRWNITSGSDWAKTTIDLTAPDSGTGPLDNVEAVAIENVAGTTVYWDEMRLQTDADCEGHCLSTFNDLRFTDSDGNELDYWIESISGTTPNQVATIWVELDSVGTSSTTFYMYYGKADASAASNIANTFIIGDDFERGSNEDAVGGDWSVISGSVIISTEQAWGGTRSAKFVGSATVAEVNISLAASDNVAIRMRTYKTTNAQLYPVAYGNGTKRTVTQFDLEEDINYYDTAYRDTGANVTAATWGLFEVRNISFSGGTYDILYNDVVVKTGAGMYTNGSYDGTIRVSNGNEGAGCDSYIDNFIVRNWRSTEPALGSWGSEEAA